MSWDDGVGEISSGDFFVEGLVKQSSWGISAEHGQWLENVGSGTIEELSLSLN